MLVRFAAIGFYSDELFEIVVAQQEWYMNYIVPLNLLCMVTHLGTGSMLDLFAFAWRCNNGFTARHLLLTNAIQSGPWKRTYYEELLAQPGPEMFYTQ